MRKLSSFGGTHATGDRPVLTLRGVDSALRSALEAEAARLGMSLNSVVLGLLRTSLGLSEETALHHDLDGLAGVWSPQEAAEFADAVRQFEEVDPFLWASDPAGP